MKRVSFVALAAGISLTGTAQALTYNLEFPTAANAEIANSTYGDNGQADLSYRAIDPLAYGDVVTTGVLAGWETGYGDLDHALWGTPNPSHGEIRFEALDPLQTVTLNSLEMGGWVADEAAEWFIYDLSWNLLQNGNGIAPDFGAHLDVTPAVSALGGLIFQWGADAWDVGINNVNYSVSGTAVVPLPTAALLLLGGLGALGAIRRRRT